MKKNIQDYKKESTLNKIFRYPEGVMSRREWLKMWQVKGATVEENNVRNYAAEEKLKDSIDRRKFNIPWGNSCHPETKKWNEDKALLAAGIYKTVYCLREPGGRGSYDITKTEYDYFKGMELAEDINTQKMELPNKIEAGTATPEEIEADELTEMEYFNKYAN